MTNAFDAWLEADIDALRNRTACHIAHHRLYMRQDPITLTNRVERETPRPGRCFLRSWNTGGCLVGMPGKPSQAEVLRTEGHAVEPIAAEGWPPRCG